MNPGVVYDVLLQSMVMRIAPLLGQLRSLSSYEQQVSDREISGSLVLGMVIRGTRRLRPTIFQELVS